MLNQHSSLVDFQQRNREIYLVTNDRSYSSSDLLSCLHRNITQVLKAVRKTDHKDLHYRLCMSLSWSMALANRFHIDMATELWKFFPGCCPYCKGVPCNCKERADHRQSVVASRDRPVSLRDWQKMFASIYINPIQVSAIHLAEEGGEVAEAMRNHAATHDGQWFAKSVEELIDVVTNVFGVANCLSFDMAPAMAGYFCNDCPKCNCDPCACPYVTVDEPVPLSSKIV